MYSGKRSPQMILLILFSLATMLLTACGGSTTSQTKGMAPANQQILVLPLSGYSDVATFDPALATESSAITVINMAFTGLVQLDDHLQVRDELAASHSVSSDGLTWTFKLKPNLKFSDGKPLTSADVAYSIDRALEPDLKSPVAPLYLGLIKDSDKRYSGQIKSLINDSILTPDNQTVILIANKRAAYFLQTLTYQTSYVVEKSMIDKYGNNFADHLSQGIGGDGPFKVDKYIHGKEVDFVPNPNFFGPKPKVKKVVMPIFQQNDTTYKAYQANQVDQAPVPSAQSAAARALPNGQFHQVPLLEVQFYTMNYLVKPFDNVKIRQAFALAVNKDEIAHNIYKDTVIATNHIIPTGMSGYNPNLTGPLGTSNTNCNPNLAKQVFQEGLREEGLTPATFPPVTITVSTQGSAAARDEYAAVQQMWKNTLGVTVKINDVDQTTLITARNNSLNNPNGLQMWALYWSADYPDPQDWLTLIFGKDSSKNGFNYGQNHSSAAAEQQANQQLMEEADANPNPAARIKQYNQAEQQLVNDVVWIPRFQNTTSSVRKSCVVGIVDNAQNFIPQDDWGSIYLSTATPCADTGQYQ
ncbi:MAG TPA: peptide ABC transporter substrate-binding protein [Ktedonobacteraceae bacterium]|jgi:peptide/nickel transport system substrate-binding protein/oligopeptide transport system substrate-binding protein|nr:peptide ABC transporter substrate-binding protein [Ktedonobacteraceae bacterium]